MRAGSASLAGRNLHLVIPQGGTQPLILRYSIFNLGMILRARQRKRQAIKVPRACRVLRSFEPAIAGGSPLRNAALAQAYRVISVRQETLCIGVGPKRRVQYHEHSRAKSLYHIQMSVGREKLTIGALQLF